MEAKTVTGTSSLRLWLQLHASVTHLIFLLLFLGLHNIVAEWSVLVFLARLFRCNRPPHGICHASHEESAEEVFKWCRGVRQSQQLGRQLVVDEEDDHPKVDEGMWDRDVAKALTQEEDRCQDALLCHTVWQMSIIKSRWMNKFLCLVLTKTGLKTQLHILMVMYTHKSENTKKKSLTPSRQSTHKSTKVLE